MTWSSIPKRLPMEVDRWVTLSSLSVYLLGLSKHKVIGQEKTLCHKPIHSMPSGQFGLYYLLSQGRDISPTQA
jgi:hypothetical protein